MEQTKRRKKDKRHKTMTKRGGKLRETENTNTVPWGEHKLGKLAAQQISCCDLSRITA
ncbi:hypothetical protein APL35_gp046 [Apis mellifera filamentous virus]|uniref:hypothetical protein n=1 Tax=Apis mellifera filamentous virus TaxID=1100043 RepID=UPI0006BD1FAB|nr:hypothetical protein APL35_gp046 [Apis mellifera filamentous virus]